MSKIVAPNYTQIPNVIFDYWMEKLSPAQFKILLCICRKTFGYHKEKDRISLRQIESMSGMGKKAIIEAIKVLEEHELLIKFQSTTEWGDPAPNQYEINVCEIEDEIQKGGGSVLKTQGGSVLKTPLTTKENNTKEIYNLSNDKFCSDVQKLHSEPKKKEVNFNFEKGIFEGIDERDRAKWQKAYPNANIELEISRAEEWLLSNPTKAKQKKLFRKFISTWLSKADAQALMRSARSSQQSFSCSSSDPRVEQNFAIVQDAFNQVPTLREKIKLYGKKNLVNKKTGNDLSFEIDPYEFKRAFYKLAGVEEYE